MNFLDVVSATLKNGGSFKLEDDDTIYVIKGGMICFANEAVQGIDPFCATLVSSILAENWELVEPEVRITKAQFVQAWRDTCKCNPDSIGPVGYFAEELAKRLGLERK